jgi:hypothetical protein
MQLDEYEILMLLGLASWVKSLKKITNYFPPKNHKKINQLSIENNYFSR